MKLSRPILHRVRLTDAVVFWPAVLLIVWGSLVPSPSLQVPPVNDKLLHFISYFILSTMGVAAFRARRPALLVGLGLIVLGGMLEILQGFVGRQTSFTDQLANTLGVLAGGILARLAVERLRRRFPERQAP